ncbi:arginyl-tRNA synthetase [Coemansia javaensis]|uniref:arginine--tRNA ligase n=1 Tax=Coemansia javaensis TaxID=2761396 RepID=A0A9W8H7B3_9FUNG|nr:arginyl-tRNA synthetase [Coemansia javaensis]
MFEDFKAEIARQISELSGVAVDAVEPAIGLPNDTVHGDLALTVPRLRMRGNPVQIAKTLAEQFKPACSITGAVATGPYVNFRIDRPTITGSVLRAVQAAGAKFGTTTEGAGKRLVVDFSSPNIAKPFHAGHLRSTIIGNFICNVHRAHGWDAVGINYLGDWGKQYGLLALGFERYGSEEALTENPIAHLFEIYVRMNAAAKEDETVNDDARAYFRRMEDGDGPALALWQRFRDLSIEKYKSIYARLGINFEVYSGESQVTEPMLRALQMLEDSGLVVVEQDGSRLVDLEAHRLGRALIRKRDGTTLYLTRDIGAAMDRYEKYSFDKSVYVVASAQDHHFKQLFKIVEALGLPFADRLLNISFGVVRGMSTRTGEVVFLEDILNEAKAKMHSVMRDNEAKYANVVDPERTADLLGMSAIYIQDMSARRIKDYDFDWDRMLNNQGDTGPYLQFTHTRLCSIERMAHVPVNPDADVSLLTEDSAYEIVTLISRYPDVLASAFKTLEPCNIVQYLFKLAHAVSFALEGLKVRGQPDDLAQARLLLFSSARVVLANALSLLGLEPIERM